MFGLPTSFWYSLIVILLFEIAYLFVCYKRWIKERRAQLIIADLEFTGTVIAVLSVASASGVKFGDYSPQVVRWESAGVVSFYLLILAWQIKKDLIKGVFTPSPEARTPGHRGKKHLRKN
jgi:hypothetical protein